MNRSETQSYRDFDTGRFLPRAFMKFGWDNYAPDEKTRSNPYAVPMRASVDQLRGLPSALVITAENDSLRDEGEAYARKLKEAGVAVTATRYTGTAGLEVHILNGADGYSGTIMQLPMPSKYAHHGQSYQTEETLHPQSTLRQSLRQQRHRAEDRRGRGTVPRGSQINMVFEANGALAPRVLSQPTGTQIQTPQLRVPWDYWTKLKGGRACPREPQRRP